MTEPTPAVASGYRYARGELLGCPDCAAGEPHVCPFLHADRLPEPRRTRILAHLRRELADVQPDDTDPAQASLFPDLQPTELEPVERLSPDRRRTRRQRDAIAAGRHPLTGGPINHAGTCGTCQHRMAGGQDRYPKCLLKGPDDRYLYVTSGAATDCRAWWPACDRFERA